MIVFQGARRRPVVALAFHPDGKRIAVGVGGHDWTTFSDATTATKLADWAVTSVGIPHNMQFHPSGRWLFFAGGENGLFVLRVQTGHVHEQQPAAYGLSLAPDGGRVVVKGAGDRLASYLVHPKDGEPSFEWAMTIGNAGEWVPQTVAFFPDGERFASCEYRDAHEPEIGPDEARLVVRSASDGSLLSELGAARGTPWQAEVPPDGEWVALRVGGELLLFPAAGGKSVKPAAPNKKHPTGIAFHPGGRYLAVTCNDRTVRMHDRDANWAIARTFEWDAGRLKSVAFNADGTLAAAGSDTGKVVVWDVDL
jgi:WD40 repeat protein